MDVAPGSAEESRADRFHDRIRQAGRGEGDAADEIVAGILEEQRRAHSLVANLVDALVGAFFERDIEEWRDAKTLRLASRIAQRQQSNVARPVRRREDDIFQRQIAAQFGEGRHAWLIDDVISRILTLEGRKSRSVGLGGIEIAQRSEE